MGKENQPGAVLLSDQIEWYATNYQMIEPFDRDNLKPASYQLSVGCQTAIGGHLKELKGKGDIIEIHPFNVAIIQTKEKIKMPDYLIARWNIRVTLAYDGLLWVGGPQVDPGYEGHLYCPIYNLSNESKKLSIGDKIATIDFTLTTRYTSDVKKFVQKRKDDIQEYNYKLQSGLFTEVGQKIAQISKENDDKINKLEESTNKAIQEIRARLDAFIFSVITIIGIILTVISVLIVFSTGHDLSVPAFALVNLILSIIAIMGIIYIISEKDIINEKILKLNELQRQEKMVECERET